MATRMVVLVMVGVAGCSARGSVPHAEADGGSDAGNWDYEPGPCAEGPFDRACFCGDAGFCNVANADSCREGSCACGIGPPCGDGEDCRFGRCHPVDPEGEVCEFDDVCAAGFGCIEAHCSRVACVPEDCDGIDNDCDGTIDGDARGPLTEWCFSGPEDRAANPPCERGFRVCEGGAWGPCEGEVPPVDEQGLLGCDDVDNDCDGCVDGVFEGGVCVGREPAGFDIVFAIDTSGSMAEEIAAVKSAVNDFAAAFSASPEFRFAIVLVPSDHDYDRPEILQDLADFATFAATLMTVTTNGAGSEPSWDAIYEMGTGELALDWGEGTTRILILVTDEEGQSYRASHGLSAVDEAGMCGALTRGEVLAAVADPSFYSDFDDCGLTFPISSDAAAMVDSLEMIIADPCT